MKLTEPMITSADSAQTQDDTPGNYTPIYTPTAVISAMQVTIHKNQ